MALDTVATHLAGLGETRARTRELESSTRARDTLLPYEVEKKSLDNDSARLILSELHKDVAYNDLVRENKITDQQSVRDMYDALGPTRLVANLLVAKEVEAKQNDVKLVVAENDLRLNKIGPFYNSLKDHFDRIGDPSYDAVAGLNRLEGQYDMLNQELTTLGFTDQRKQIDADGNFTESGDMVTAFGMLPGGRSQGEPITADNFANFTSHMTIMEDYSKEANSMLKQRLAEESATERAGIKAAGTAGDAPDPTSVTETGAVSGHMLKALQGVLPEGFAVDDATGKVTVAPGYGGSVQTINDWATAAVTSAMDKNPSANIAGIENQVAKHIGNNIQPYQAEAKTWLGMGGGDDPHTYNTFIPTKGSDSLRREGITQAEYIQKLEALIKQEEGRRNAQSIADEVFRNNFSNMVTTSP